MLNFRRVKGKPWGEKWFYRKHTEKLGTSASILKERGDVTGVRCRRVGMCLKRHESPQKKKTKLKNNIVS